ncbi:TerD family protein [Streptomyces celluloflavus]|uniref:Tellurium resistance n=2 Tax=Streptomyces TaxID=1883 RepID=A0A4Q9I116_STRKA|nr:MULTISPECIES: Tellurium resistance [Streptomyces]MYU50818.1 Tellurium resistance [Streptomyces sp. SID7805]TBO61336.1 Tellurium resistance [Streptomyces kasugaensis]WSK17423.1 Tellurium resistance [Streptomyces celluloflavus]
MSFLGNWSRGGAPKFDNGGASYVVELTKRHPVVSLTKQGAAAGHLRVNLHWQMRTSDFGDRGGRRVSTLLRHPGRMFKPEVVQAQGPAVVQIDLDLACMYELKDGSKGVVQPLGNHLGELNAAPYVQLSGDDRFGSPSGETLYINLDHQDEIKRMLIFVYIYDGTPAFDRTHAVVTLYPSTGPRVEIRLDERASQARSCAIFMLENTKDGLTVRREVKYVYGFQAELDRLYGWGLHWGRGYKSQV